MIWSKVKALIIIPLLFVVFICMPLRKVHGYYGSGLGSSLYGGSLYGLGGLGSYGLGGLGGYGLGSSLYGLGGLGSYGLGSSLYGLGGLRSYGLGGLGNYGLGGLGMYGLGGLGGYGLGSSLYGGSLYGLGGLSSYGLGGLGMYGLGGLGSYGLGSSLYGGSLYGLGGLGNYGLGGLGGYGLYGGSLYGLGGLGSIYRGNITGSPSNMGTALYFGASGLGAPLGLGVMNPLLSLGGLGLLGSSSTGTAGITPAYAPSPVVTAEQAGSWDGYWFSYLKTIAGPMTLNLVEDVSSNVLAGSCLMINNKFIPVPVDVAGVNTGTGTFLLEGIYFDPLNLITYTIELTCIMTGPTTMTGDFFIHDQLFTKTNYGEFTLSLIVPYIPTPVVSPTVVAPTAVAPTLIAPTLIAPTLIAPTAATIPAAISGGYLPLFWLLF